MSSRFFYTVEQIDQLLVGRIESLARHLAPDGDKRGHEWAVRLPGRQKLGSMSINLNSGVWSDFSAGQGSKTLPGLGLVAYLATEGDFKRAIVWAKDWLGLTGEKPDAAIAQRLEREKREADERKVREKESKRRTAFAMFLNARALDGTDPASRYLRGRGIEAKFLENERFPRSLRFHAGITHRSHAGRFPALVACQSLEGMPGGFGGVHRIYLGQFNGRWDKAFGTKESKLSLGYQAGASVRIAKGASGKDLAKAPAGEWVHVCEGVEDALSLSVAVPGRRVVAAYSIAAIKNLWVPAHVGGVVIVRDNDDPESEAEAALESAALELCDKHAVKIARMPEIYKDVNDCLLDKRREPA